MHPAPSSQIRELVQAKLAGRKIDVVGFVDKLLDLAKKIGVIRCSLSVGGSLRIELRDHGACDVELDACQGKLRMLCARLGVLCNDAAVSPYGGAGVIQKTPSLESGNGNAHSSDKSDTWNIHFKNTGSEQEFSIVFVPIEKPGSHARKDAEPIGR